jgi:tetratricopeptide (TPR) repeat protein
MKRKTAALSLLIFAMAFCCLNCKSKTRKTEKQKTDANAVLRIGDTTYSRDYLDYVVNLTAKAVGIPLGDNYLMNMMIKAMAIKSIVNEEMLLREAGRRGIKGAGEATDTDTEAGRAKRKELMARAENMLAKELSAGEEKKQEQRALDVWNKLGKGEPFDKLAETYSEDKAGILDMPRNRDDLDPALREVAFSLNIGQYSRPLRTNFGYEIIQVTARKNVGDPEYEYFIEATKASLKAGDKMPSEIQLKHMYETVNLKHILFKVKDGTTLVREWADTEGGKQGYKILDDELAAFMLFFEEAFNRGKSEPSQIALDKAIQAYDNLTKTHPDNFNLYFMIGYIHEAKNKLSNEAEKKQTKEIDSVDPYAANAPALTKPKSNPKYLDEALKAYAKAYDISKKQTNTANIDVVTALARTNRLLWEADEKTGEKYRAQALKFYIEAIPLAGYRFDILQEIKDAFEKLGDKKNLAKVQQLIGELMPESGK